MEESGKSSKSNAKKKRAVVIALALMAAVGGLIVVIYMGYASRHITTDDAFVDGRIHTISSRVPGKVESVVVSDNQFVRHGDVLVEIDRADYDVLTAEAESALQAEVSRLEELQANIRVVEKKISELEFKAQAARARLALQEARLEQAELDIKRAENLFRNDAISAESREQAETDYDVASAQVQAATDSLREAESSIETQKAIMEQSRVALEAQQARVEQREAILESAKLKQSYTRVYAPSDGYVTRKSVEVGNHVQAGQPLMAVVPLEDIWVIANYKETQLEKVRPGQRVRIKVDTYSGQDFSGTVDSIMAGTGAVFSLFPPENATGNFVKIVQRIPVKIVLDEDADLEHKLRIGMSVVPTILIED
jgi:membrane fusion protein (multidrug efflux system)